MTLLNKFSLSGKKFLSVALNGIDAEIRLTGPRKSPFFLSHLELDLLCREKDVLLHKDVHIGSSVDVRGVLSQRKCTPDLETGGILLVTEWLSDAQPLDLSDLVLESFILEKHSAQILIQLLPKILETVEHLQQQRDNVLLAYDVVRDQLGRLYELYGHPTDTYEHFLTVVRALHTHIPISFLVKDFKSRSPGVLFSVPELMKTVLCQFQYIYNEIYSK